MIDEVGLHPREDGVVRLDREVVLCLGRVMRRERSLQQLAGEVAQRHAAGTWSEDEQLPRVQLRAAVGIRHRTVIVNRVHRSPPE